MSAARYLRRLAAAALLLVAALAALNFYADPYGVWHHGLPGDSIHSRPAIRNQERLHKAHAVRLADADCILLGTSRVLVGLDPRHPALPAKSYNLGLSAANMYECWRTLQHAAALKKPSLVLLAIDKGMFDADSRPEVDFDERRLAVAADGTPQPRWRWADIPETLLSIDAIIDSVKTLRARGSVTYPGGMRDAELLLPYQSAAKVLAENERWREGSRHFAWMDKKGGNAQCTAFENILSYCDAEGIRLIVFTNPLHAEMLEIEYDAQLELWHDWLLATLTIPEPREFTNFYAYNVQTTEPFPAPTDKLNTMQHYWEISHYRKSVGDQVLARLLAAPRETAQRAAPFIEQLRAERQQWKGGGK